MATYNYESCLGSPDYTLVTQGTAVTSTQTLPSLRFSDSDIMLWNKVIEKIINWFGKCFKHSDETFSGWWETWIWGRFSHKECPRLVTAVLSHTCQDQSASREGYLQTSLKTTFDLPHPTAFLIMHLNAEWLKQDLKLLWPLSQVAVYHSRPAMA